VVGGGEGVLKGGGGVRQEGAAGPAEFAGDPLDAHKAGRSICVCRLQELDGAVTGDVTGKALLDVDSGQHGSFARLVIRRRLVLLDGDNRACPGSPRAVAHVGTSVVSSQPEVTARPDQGTIADRID